jgi:ribonuclease HI
VPSSPSLPPLTVIHQGSATLPAGCTNNEVEYDGFLSGITAAASLLQRDGVIQAYGDSQLVVQQVLRTAACRHKRLIPLCNMAKELWEPWKVNGSTLEHRRVPRTQHRSGRTGKQRGSGPPPRRLTESVDTTKHSRPLARGDE